MANPLESRDFMLILRGGTHPKDLSPDQIQKFMTQFGAWMAQMQGANQLKIVGRLEDEGRRLSNEQDQIIVDGPYAETKEVVGGYFVISARDIDSAVEIAKGCPILQNQGTVEVRLLQQAPQS